MFPTNRDLSSTWSGLQQQVVSEGASSAVFQHDHYCKLFEFLKFVVYQSCCRIAENFRRVPTTSQNNTKSCNLRGHEKKKCGLRSQ